MQLTDGRSPLSTCFQMLGTFLLTFTARLLIWLPGESRLSDSASIQLYTLVLAPFFVGLLITLAGLSAGGPTGPSLNPARDLGPRLAHWLLPINGKGTTSEWIGGEEGAGQPLSVCSFPPLSLSSLLSKPAAF